MTSTIKVNTIQDSGGNTILSSDGAGTITQTASIGSFSSTGIDDNASSTAITINSSGNVGIGTTIPNVKLEIYDVDPYIRLTDSVAPTGYSQVMGTYQGGLVLSADYSNSVANSLVRFDVDSSERARIDSSGNLLVSTTNSIAGAGNTDVGVVARADGGLFASRGGSASLFNRNTSDGDVVQFRKDGTTVGSIFSRVGVVSGIILDPRAGGHGILAQTNSLITVDESQTRTDSAVDLGNSSYRWNNLYLGGNIYLGGTGSANALDDYEEGTWTPSATFATANPTAGASTGVGEYIKVGDMVTVWGGFTNINVTGASGDSTISGFPFTSKLNVNLTAYKGVINAGVVSFGTSNTLVVDIPDGQSFGRVLQNRDNASINIVQASQYTDGQTDLFFTITYKVS